MFVNHLSSHAASYVHKNFLWLFFLCCVLPLIIAELTLSFAWMPSKTINKGEWLEQDLQLLPARLDVSQHWSLVYVQAEPCDQSCEMSLYAIQQIYIGLGRHQEKLNLYVVSSNFPQQLAQFPAVKWRAPDYPLAPLQNHIYIANQQGLALLRYSVIQDKKTLLETSKDIRTDLLRLINYDRGSL